MHRLGIGALPQGRGFQTQRVFPANVIPVIDVVGECDEIIAFGQFAQQPVGRRARTSALTGEQLNDHRSLRRDGILGKYQ